MMQSIFDQFPEISRLSETACSTDVAVGCSDAIYIFIVLVHINYDAHPLFYKTAYLIRTLDFKDYEKVRQHPSKDLVGRGFAMSADNIVTCFGKAIVRFEYSKKWERYVHVGTLGLDDSSWCDWLKSFCVGYDFIQGCSVVGDKIILMKSESSCLFDILFIQSIEGMDYSYVRFKEPIPHELLHNNKGIIEKAGVQIKGLSKQHVQLYALEFGPFVIVANSFGFESFTCAFF